MTVELKPSGLGCNLACSYCYQEAMRLAGQGRLRMDIEAIKKIIRSTKSNFSLFGGEALLTPKKILEELFKFGLEMNEIIENPDDRKSTSIQTNGTLIDEDHIAMFKKYGINVGVSIDGPDELNSLRKVRGSEEDDDATLAATKRTIESIQWLASEGITVTVIITLHKINASADRLPRLMSFLQWLGTIGVAQGNIHTLEVDSTLPDQENVVLSGEESAEAMLALAQFFKQNQQLHYQPFIDMKQALSGDDEKSICIWNRCDPMNTDAVYGIEADAGLSNCGRVNKDGINWYKANDHGYERYTMLYNTPQELGGCRECPYFLFCGGGCPGEAQDGDVRNKTIYCSMYKQLFSHFEQEIEEEGSVPFTKNPERLRMESLLMDALAHGQNLRMTDMKKILQQRDDEVMNFDIQMVQIPVLSEGEESLHV